jgi:pyruvate kinase
MDRERLDRAVCRLDEILDLARGLEERYRQQLDQVHPEQRLSAHNLLHYLALRREDLRDLQGELSLLGLSRLGRAESHVMAAILAVRHALHRLRGDDVEPPTPPLGFEEGRRRLQAHKEALLGDTDGVSSVGIMVTLPTEAGADDTLVRDMLEAGMTCVRINCSQDSPEVWKKMIDNVKVACAELGRSCRVFMDLGGPKMRIGDIAPGPKIIRIRRSKDDFGRTVRASRVALVPESGSCDQTGEEPRIPVPGSFLTSVGPGLRVELTDTRGKHAELHVEEVAEGVVFARCQTGLYVQTGTQLTLRDTDGQVIATCSVGELPALEQVLTLHVGDSLWIHKENRLGEPTQWDADGTLIAPAHVASIFPEVLDDVEVGETLLLDDGRIGTVVREKRADGIVVEVTRAKPEGTRLKGHKGFNLPDSHVRLTGLTEQDVEDLTFVAEHADVVNVSFVNEPDDVEDLCDCLDTLGADHLGVVLKIETKRGYKNLPGILLAALERPSVGVMIARGDLAVEAGWLNLARVQEEIMWLCEAAHVPVIWATQVLEQLAKKGQPTRAEISDVAMAERAECVMLNKGPFIIDAIRTLDTVLGSMEAMSRKKAPLLNPLELDDPDPTEVGRAVGTRVGRFG